MGSPKFFGSNFLSFALTFRTAVLLGFGDVVGDGVEEVAAAGVGVGLAGDVGAVWGDEPPLHAAADVTTNAPATASDVRRKRRGATISLTIAPSADVLDSSASGFLSWLLIAQ
jgi:hypothetical protein